MPWQYLIAWRLLDKFTETEVWNMPLPKAVAWNACHLDSEGENDLQTEEELELLQKVKELPEETPADGC